MARLLFIVSRRQPTLYAYLVRQFATEAEVQVLLDRRTTERRRGAAPGSSRRDRRQADRRRNRDAAYQLLTMGYAFAEPAGGVS